ncbi:hypothetical protein FACS1894187_16630 [Synergistales bacterium]|nr:hypothetical protein FACS1894187_16630 [Synergistales bacterium]
MRTDTALRVEAISILISAFGEVDTERFIKIIKNDRFDYTEWQKSLWPNIDIEELHSMATDYERRSK